MDIEKGDHTYPIRVEYIRRRKNPGVRLLWGYRSQQVDVVPKPQLYGSAGEE